VVKGRVRGKVQLRTRVLAGVLLITLVTLAAFDVAAVTALRKYLFGRTDSRLHAVLSLYRPVALPPFQAIRRPVHGVPPGKRLIGRAAVTQVKIVGPHLPLRPAILAQYYLGFLPGHGGLRGLLQGNPDLKPKLPAHLHSIGATGPGWNVISSNGHAQLRLQAVRIGGGTLFATTSLAAAYKTLDKVQFILIVGSAAAALIVVVGVTLVLRRGLRPIETMAAQADRITAGDLTDRVSLPDPRTEVGRLGEALNGMLARIEAAISEREASQELTNRFFADASHELRNPLASLRANAELYQQGVLLQRAQVDEAMCRISLEAQRMSSLVDDMLRLARLDQHPSRESDTVDLTELVACCAQQARVADPRRAINAVIAADLVTVGDEELLRRAVDNLLANVRVHTPEGTDVTITATQDNGAIVIQIADTGPGVPPDQLPRIFDRFYRAGAQAHRPGSGLGLAIVAAIAQAHDGTAQATLNNPHGLRITLALPPSKPSSRAAAALAATQ
jgi:two-component system OmpR family sensor kinase